MAGIFEQIQTGLENFLDSFNQYLDIGKAPSKEVSGQMSKLNQLVQKKPIKRGDRGYPVRLLQGGLKTVGYYKVGKVDGIFGPKTETAVKNFQKDQGLAVTGVVGSPTVQALYAEVQRAAQRGQLIPELVNLAAQRGMMEVFEEYPELMPAERERAEPVTPPVQPVEEKGVNWKPILIGGGLLGLGILLLRR